VLLPVRQENCSTNLAVVTDLALVKAVWTGRTWDDLGSLKRLSGEGRDHARRTVLMATRLEDEPAKVGDEAVSEPNRVACPGPMPPILGNESHW
jgi:hypothetical protein